MAQSTNEKWKEKMHMEIWLVLYSWAVSLFQSLYNTGEVVMSPTLYLSLSYLTYSAIACKVSIYPSLNFIQNHTFKTIMKSKWWSLKPLVLETFFLNNHNNNKKKSWCFFFLFGRNLNSTCEQKQNNNDSRGDPCSLLSLESLPLVAIPSPHS